jgi:hypothetical protein
MKAFELPAPSARRSDRLASCSGCSCSAYPISRTGILLDVLSTEAALRAAWETWTVERRHAVVAAVLPVVVGSARRGKRFDADRVTPNWRI